MKNTGVVRQVDELGRIVIPKEVRRSLRIREGEHLEIYIDDSNSIILRKYSPIESINNYAEKLAESLNSSSKKNVIITDNEQIVAASGDFSINLIGKNISSMLDEKIHRGSMQIFSKNDAIEITNNYVLNKASILKPINVNGSILGSVMIVNENITEVEKALIDYSTTFLSKFVE